MTEILIRKATCKERKQEEKNGIIIPNGTGLYIPKTGICSLNCSLCKSQNLEKEKQNEVKSNT